jgi:hypothetical protein
MRAGETVFEFRVVVACGCLILVMLTISTLIGASPLAGGVT